jgi:hypothetical protein
MDLSSQISDHCDKPLVGPLFVDHEAAASGVEAPAGVLHTPLIPFLLLDLELSPSKIA